MLFNTFFTLLAFVATFAISSVQATNTIVAYGNDDCTGSVGNTVNCDNSCHSFAGRHSIQPSGGTNCIQYYTGSDCSGSRINVFSYNDMCLKVDTGGPVGSFRCKSDSNFCQDV
ncbi:hypothetical protein CVT25_014462 [Psilocybe cyanescens]|uniref:Uncharacterized protein n=1 Tax=Psilocybe cyanescens TaxID=93625 RepID=A0A409XR85_PSICY|nr:hypothetical protein CVT25_014462 [Psilocybe cyanescens]